MMPGPEPSGLETAPFYQDLAEGPSGAEAYWVVAEDGTRIRMAVWPQGPRGTVFMFPGRTEYVEKYGRVAADLAAAGYGMVSFDYRGQGLSDRPAHQRDMGHVETFDEYRQDMAAFFAGLAPLKLPKPWYMIGHSMGGCIGLRALYDGFEVTAAAFTGPMWGLQMTPFLKPLSPLILSLAKPLGIEKKFAMTMGPWKPIPFQGNRLTTDKDQFDYMARQTEERPELALGGPSYKWVKLAVEETASLMEMEPLDLPTVAIVGSEEKIVSIDATRDRMATWPNGTYIEVSGAEHEVLMEDPARRGRTMTAILDHFAAHPG